MNLRRLARLNLRPRESNKKRSKLINARKMRTLVQVHAMELNFISLILTMKILEKPTFQSYNATEKIKSSKLLDFKELPVLVLISLSVISISKILNLRTQEIHRLIMTNQAKLQSSVLE